MFRDGVLLGRAQKKGPRIINKKIDNPLTEEMKIFVVKIAGYKITVEYSFSPKSDYLF